MPILMSIGARKIPTLEEYGIDPITGFLPRNPPLKKLPKYFEPWEQIMDKLNAYILTGKLRETVETLPELSVSSLTTIEELRRAYCVLTFLGQSYLCGVVGTEDPRDILPRAVAVPWFEVAKKLRINPVVSYSGVGLWNWHLLNDSGPMDLSNLYSLNTFTGCYDESWFYLVPIAIEIAGAPIISAIVNAQEAVLVNNDKVILECLETINTGLSKMIPILKRMYEKCNPSVFYQRIRPYSGGSKNSELFPNGVFYEGVKEIDKHVVEGMINPEGKVGTWRKYPGASAGQSPLIHSIDVGLGITHKPQGVFHNGPRPDFGDVNLPNPMLEMREALPGPFQDFIIAIDNGPSIREFCSSSKNTNEKLKSLFNSACALVSEFRSIHLQLVSAYIVAQKTGKSTMFGTGGTDLIPFLKQVRKETDDNLL